MISAVCAARAGIVIRCRVTSGQPRSGHGMELDAVGAVLIGCTSLKGGVGTIQGLSLGFLFWDL